MLFGITFYIFGEFNNIYMLFKMCSTLKAAIIVFYLIQCHISVLSSKMSWKGKKSGDCKEESILKMIVSCSP